MKATGLLANVLRSARRQADEETVSEARKTELEDWIERNEAEIDARIEVSKQILSKWRFGNAVAGRIHVASPKEKLTGRVEAWSTCWSRSGSREG